VWRQGALALLGAARRSVTATGGSKRVEESVGKSSPRSARAAGKVSRLRAQFVCTIKVLAPACRHFVGVYSGRKELGRPDKLIVTRRGGGGAKDVRGR